MDEPAANIRRVLRIWQEVVADRRRQRHFQVLNVAADRKYRPDADVRAPFGGPVVEEARGEADRKLQVDLRLAAREAQIVLVEIRDVVDAARVGKSQPPLLRVGRSDEDQQQCSSGNDSHDGSPRCGKYGVRLIPTNTLPGSRHRGGIFYKARAAQFGTNSESIVSMSNSRIGERAGVRKPSGRL